MTVVATAMPDDNADAKFAQPSLVARMIDDTDTEEAEILASLKFLTKEQVAARTIERIRTYADYKAYLATPRRGKSTNPDQIMLLKMLFIAMDRGAAIVTVNLDDNGFSKYIRHEFDTKLIQGAYQFFENQVKDFCIGRKWIDDRNVEIKINPTASRAHGHRRSYS